MKSILNSHSSSIDNLQMYMDCLIPTGNSTYTQVNYCLNTESTLRTNLLDDSIPAYTFGFVGLISESGVAIYSKMKSGYWSYLMITPNGLARFVYRTSSSTSTTIKTIALT